jgi:membrane protein
VANNALSKLKKAQEAVLGFFNERGIEREDAPRQSWVMRTAHFWLLVCKSFSRNRCPVRASALAFSSLLALIPMLAVVFGIATGVLKSRGQAPARMLVDKLISAVAPYTESTLLPDAAPTDTARQLAETKREEAVQKITEFINNAQSGTVGVTGMIALVVVALSMLIRIEATFNDIWGLTRGRSWYMQVILYWAVITLGPILLIVALGLTSGEHFEQSKKWLMDLPFIGGLAFKILPIVVLSVMFAVFYQLMPNTRVQPRAAMAGGVVAGLLWYFNNVLGVVFVSRVTSNNAIYGSIGMIPVLMIGLYFGWMILLFGAQVAYAWQNRAAYLAEKRTETVNQRGRELAALRVMAVTGRAFQEGRPPPGINQLSATLGLPSKLVSQVLRVLIQSRLIVETQDSESGYTPARPLRQITAHDVLHALRVGNGQDFSAPGDTQDSNVLGAFDRIYLAEQTAADAVTLQDLISRPG